jgi:hypothetical protein
MGADWKDKLRQAKRLLEENRLKEFLRKRHQEREAQRQPAKQPSPSKPALNPPKGLSLPGVRPASVQPQSVLRHAALPPAPPWAGLIPAFNIGIDFGTSSTKICGRRHKGVVPNDPEPVYLLYIDRQSYLCPSSVLIKNDQLYFGAEAERQATSAAVPLRHLKACLACESEPATATSLAECSSVREPSTEKCTGAFHCQGQLVASQLVTLYLAWIIHEARALASQALGLSPMTAFTYHIGVPLAHLDQSPRFVEKFRRLLYDAWRISTGVIQGLTLDTGMRWLKEVSNEPVPTEDDSPVQMNPEVVASLVPFLNGNAGSVTLTPGLYGLIDIGAWTSDVAMFRYSENGTVSFPVTSVRRIGCNEIDERLRSGLFELVGSRPDASSHLFSSIRQSRESSNFQQSSFLVAKYPITPPACLQEYSERVAAGKIWRQFVETIKRAHQEWLEPYQEQTFSRFRVFMLGGGSAIVTLTKPPSYFEAAVTKIVSHLPGVPSGFKAIGSPGPSVIDYGRLAIAHGLAFAAGTWPDITRPSQVVPIKPPTRIDPLTPEDLGYDEK